MTTCLGKSCSFGLPRVPFVNCCQFMYLVISLLVLRAGYGIWIISVPDHCLYFYFVRFSHTPLNRTNERIYIVLWAHSKASPNCRNWFYSIKERSSFTTSWLNSIHRAVGPSGRGRNKLRTYCLFKSIFEAAVLLCLKVTTPRSLRQVPLWCRTTQNRNG